MTIRICPIDGCERGLQQGHLMCGRHWFRVPRNLRADIWRLVATIEGLSSPEYGMAVRAAVDAVNAKVKEEAGRLAR